MLTTPPPPLPYFPPVPDALNGVDEPPALKQLAPPAPLNPLPTATITDAAPSPPFELRIFPLVAKPPNPEPN